MQLARKSLLRLVKGGGAQENVDIAAELDDAQFVAKVAAGDGEALDAFYRRYATPVWRMLLWIVGDDHELEDLHHDVFVQAIRSAHRFRRVSTMRAWLYGIAVNCVRSKLRSRRRRRWLSFVAPDELPEPSYDQEDEGWDRVRAVFGLLEKLAPDDRIAFSLRYLEGMALAEIGEVCGVSLGTVKRRLRRGRERFMKLAALDPELCVYCEEEGTS